MGNTTASDRYYTGTIPGYYLLPVRGAGTSTVALGHCRELGLLWTCLPVRGAGTRPTRSATAASWACYGLAMDLLPVRGAGTSTVALGHCRELGLLWACYGLAVDSTARRSPLGVSGCRGVGVSGCRGVGVSGCRGVGVSGCRGVGVSAIFYIT